VTQVVAPGEFAIRGGLIDLYPMGSALPYRLDLLDDQLESIRAFDPDTQRGVYPVPEVRLLPGREFPIDEAARQGFRRRWRERVEGDPSRASVYRDIGSGIASAGIEYYLPLFFDDTATLFDYLPAASVLAFHGPLEAAIQRYWNETSERYRFLARDAARPILPPSELFLNAETFFTLAQRHGRIVLGEATPEGYASLPSLAVERRAEDPVGRLRSFADGFEGRVLIVADSAGRRETIGQMLSDYQLPYGDNADFAGFLASDARVALGVAPLHEGFVLDAPKIAIVTETELYAASPRRLRGKARERVERRRDDPRSRRVAGRRSGGPCRARNRPLPRPADDGSRQRLDRIPAPRIRERNDAVRAGRAVAPDRALQRRRSGRRTAAPTGRRRLGQGAPQGRQTRARHCGRTAEPVRAARRAQGTRVRVQVARLRSVRRGVRF
jgi:transcription-repair coupling factor (superfamily II helicase)